MQIVNGLVAFRKYSIPDADMTAEDRGESFEELLQKVRANRGSLALPSLQLRTNALSESRTMQKVVCEGFVITNK